MSRKWLLSLVCLSLAVSFSFRLTTAHRDVTVNEKRSRQKPFLVK